jgi:GntP family gluconate:H+ symporter
MMNTVVAFGIILVFITICAFRVKLPPFLTLVTASLLYGLLTGMGEEVVVHLTRGAGNIFALLGIPIFCGAIIAQIMRKGHFIPRVVRDLQKVSKWPAFSSSVSGYVLSVPFMCCITSFVVLSPVVEHLHQDRDVVRRLFYLAAFGSIMSFVLIYPLPVMYAVMSSMDLIQEDIVLYGGITFLLSLILLICGTWLMMVVGGPNMPRRVVLLEQEPQGPGAIAWVPILVPVCCILLGILVPPLGFLANINIALLAGVAGGFLVLRDSEYSEILSKGTKNAGIIIFDLAGAGALGSVIAASGFAEQIYGIMQGIIPVILLPFILAVFIQTAQGARVVTAVVTSAIIASTALPLTYSPFALILMVAAGTLIFSYVSDPYFWLIKRATGDSLSAVLKGYTLPLALAGCGILVCALIVQFLFA